MKETLPPFFIVGSTRSGTTLLRNILRLHPNLNAPEETFFYRWGEPYGSDGYRHVYLKNPTIKHHQSIDGIPVKSAKLMLEQCGNRRELSMRYAKAFLRKQDHGKRWFDKTPQNVYGVLLINAQFPGSKIVHIHRHPLNVVASLKLGKVMPKQSLIAAVNYWLEAIQIMSVYKRLPGNNLIELSYEKLIADPIETITDLLLSLEEDPTQFDFEKIITSVTDGQESGPGSIVISQEKNKYFEVLSEDEINYVLERCAPYMGQYGYQQATDV